jgi:hypothetical protein
MSMELNAPSLIFPKSFCCNCGDSNCADEAQHTRVTSYLGLSGVDTAFQLTVPICSNCRKTTRRRPSSWAVRAMVYVATTLVIFGSVMVFVDTSRWWLWVSDNLLLFSAILSLALVLAFYRFRRPKPPQTSFYQPVRIRKATLQFGEGYGDVAYIKLAFTNPDYLGVFAAANREAINARRVAVVKA